MVSIMYDAIAKSACRFFCNKFEPSLILAANEVTLAIYFESALRQCNQFSSMFASIQLA